MLYFRRFCHVALIACCAVLSPVPVFASDSPEQQMRQCNTVPQCVIWIEYVTQLDQWYDALNLAAWYLAIDRSRNPCDDDWPIPRYIVQRESGCRWDARNPSSSAGGAFQMIQSTADNAAKAIGHPELVDVNAAYWPPVLQEQAAAELWQGGAGSGHWAETR